MEISWRSRSSTRDKRMERRVAAAWLLQLCYAPLLLMLIMSDVASGAGDIGSL